ncbi:MAG: bifunctional glutamate N-acetyltransferase/amino-acid acetyltransferase ArgJ [Candidatus Omnitrophica bacterium]|nr:bifunctional glutamate N-acetyltransferase/amino-acid acetyltransferase ArgJ [Candidatus Omnitrophota bacterium]
MMKIIKKAILPKGFKANGSASGIKKSGKPDLALIYTDVPAIAAAQFTSNTVQAAPLKVNKLHLKKSRFFSAILANSGNANCFTGRQGFRDAVKSAAVLGRTLGIKQESVLVASTGIIGKRLPAGVIEKAVPGLVRGLSARGIDRAKKAIMTTDVFAKEATAVFDIGRVPVTVCGIAKGAGMISPRMATMLCFVMTDAVISPGALREALDKAVDGSFNCITVDGCMSTNDNVLLLANGAAGNPCIRTGAAGTPFSRALRSVCLELAMMMVKDGEGATKFIRITVRQARTEGEARQVALAIANSNLFKTAVYGENPNFGRIVAAAGASGIAVKEESLRVRLGPLNRRDIDVDVSLGRGRAGAAVYTSDLTPEYIKINAAYN